MRKKRKTKTTTPPSPPQSLGELMMHEAFDRITPQHCADFCAILYDPKPSGVGEPERTRRTGSLLDFAALGWAYYTYRKTQEGK